MISAAGLLALVLTAASGAPDGSSGSLSSQPGPQSMPAAAPIPLEDVAKLTVRGEAELDRPADRISINVGVVTEAPQAGPALRENNRRMSRVVEAIEKTGLTDDEYETGRFRIRPSYSRRPRQPDAEWKPQIVGYEVVNSILIRTTQLELAGEIIEAANAAGANSVEVAGFDLAEPRTYRDEAIREAASNAIADAEALAAAASVRLVRKINVILDHASVPSPEMSSAMRGRAMAEAGGPPPINAGNVTVRAAVTIVYEIAPGN